MAELRATVEIKGTPAIKQLTGEIDRLRSALEEIRNVTIHGYPTSAEEAMHRIADETLEPRKRNEALQ